jgi:hypothetical protein
MEWEPINIDHEGYKGWEDSPLSLCGFLMRLSESAHLLRYPYPSSLRRTSLYASFLGISEALHMDIFRQPLKTWFFDSLNGIFPPAPSIFGAVDVFRVIFQGF